MTSLRSLALELGLSATTVSRALDGYPEVSEDTRQRVKAAAAAQGYRPNAAARRLRKGASETVALVMPTGPGRFFEPAFVELLGVIGESLAARGHDLMLLAAPPGSDERTVYRRIIDERRADGCIVVRTRLRDERVVWLQDAGLPFVCHGRTEAEQPYAFVDGDGESGFYALTRRLAGLGHSRIAHLAAPEAFSFAGYRAKGWRGAMADAGLEPGPSLACAANEDAGQAAAARLLAGPERPTAVVCATDRIAIGAMRAAVAAGLTPGQDVAIAGHDDIHASRFTHPALTTMALDVRAMGERLVERLFERMGGADPEPGGDVFPVQQLPRASTGEAD
jgi:LacI family transcriptional regulator